MSVRFAISLLGLVTFPKAVIASSLTFITPPAAGEVNATVNFDILDNRLGITMANNSSDRSAQMHLLLGLWFITDAAIASADIGSYGLGVNVDDRGMPRLVPVSGEWTLTANNEFVRAEAPMIIGPPGPLGIYTSTFLYNKTFWAFSAHIDVLAPNITDSTQIRDVFLLFASGDCLLSPPSVCGGDVIVRAELSSPNSPPSSSPEPTTLLLVLGGILGVRVVASRTAPQGSDVSSTDHIEQ